MSEVEWLACTDPRSMLEFLRDTPAYLPSFRHLRLLACACCRHAWDLLRDGRSREAVETAERYADGRASDRKRRQAHQAAVAADGELFQRVETEARATGTYDTDESDASCAALTTVLTNHKLQLFGGLANWDKVVYLGRYRAGRRLWEQLAPTEDVAPHFVRDILGNPFRPVAFDPAWRTPSVLGVAQAIYGERRFTELPILADALEEAGCARAELLEHCRRPGEHVRGCWPVDLALGKRDGLSNRCT
jgi:hypothetical protein